LLEVRRAAIENENVHVAQASAAETTQMSCANLLHYLAVRQFDLRPEQVELSRRGLSSLGRSEAHILATIDAVIARLAADDPDIALPSELGERGPSAAEGDALLARHTVDALGPAPKHHIARLMVTLPTEASSDERLVEDLIRAGMSIARINCAHDDATHWLRMAHNVRDAARRLERPMRVMVDLPGPKLRTGPLSAGPRVVRVKPRRDVLGRVLAPARVHFCPAASVARSSPAQSPTDVVTIPFEGDLLSAARIGDELVLRDSRDRKRVFTIGAVTANSAEATADRTTYFLTGTPIECRRGKLVVGGGRVGLLPEMPAVVELVAGDLLEIHAGTAPGIVPRRDAHGALIEPGRISVNVPELFTAVRPGHRVLIDDGEIEGIARRVESTRLVVEIMRPPRAMLRAEKGINLPDSPMSIHALTDDDLEILNEVADVADMVALSYVATAEDVDRFHRALDRVGATGVCAVLKIELAAAFHNLPDLLLEALQHPPAAVMVARGDLAAEVGFERLAELQEEILWLAEAAHTPVIWATQVLESAAKRGMPSRAEITDAAWSGRAECVMLNKGPHIVETVRLLGDILTRMQGHQQKRTPTLRPLSVAGYAASVRSRTDE
jgi:pyruvate kinase